MTYKIIWCEDSHDCEDCGEYSAIGYRIYKSNILVLDRSPVAHCFSSQEFTNPYVDILNLEGVNFEEKG